MKHIFTLLQAGICIASTPHTAGLLCSPSPITTSAAPATAIYFDGNIPYLKGEDGGRLVYWNNGAETMLSNGTRGNAIAIDNAVVFIAGLGSGGEFWYNNIGFVLDGNSSASANAMVVINQ